MMEAHFSLLRDIEAELDNHHMDAALRTLKSLSAAPKAGESVRKLRRSAIDLLAQLADLRAIGRAHKPYGPDIVKTEQVIIADAMSLIDDARNLAQRGAFSTEALASARQLMDTHTIRHGERAGQKGSIFISYRRVDTAHVAGRLYDSLCKAFGEDRTFMDVESIPLGMDYRVHIVNILSRCRACLVLIGAEWLACRDAANRRRIDDAVDPVRLEIETALRVGVPVVPVLVGNTALPQLDELPDEIKQLHFNNGAPLRPNPDFTSDVQRLIDRLANYV